MREIRTLSAREQFVIREIIKKGKLERYRTDYKLLLRYEKISGRKYWKYDLVYRSINRVIRKLVKDKILKKEKVSLNVTTKRTVRRKKIPRYTIKRYWASYHQKELIRCKKGYPLLISLG